MHIMSVLAKVDLKFKKKLNITTFGAWTSLITAYYACAYGNTTVVLYNMHDCMVELLSFSNAVLCQSSCIVNVMDDTWTWSWPRVHEGNIILLQTIFVVSNLASLVSHTPLVLPGFFAIWSIKSLILYVPGPSSCFCFTKRKK